MPVTQASAIDYGWNLAGDGLWTLDANWSPVGQPGAAGDNVTIAHPSDPVGAVAVGLTASRAVGFLTLGASSGGTNTLNVANNITLSLNGDLTNQGLLNLNSTGNNTTLSLSANLAFNGNGRVVLNGALPRLIGGVGVVLTNNAAHNIEGKGEVASNTLQIVNNGLIRANVAGQTLTLDVHDASTSINTGMLTATNGANLAIGQGTWDNAGGLVVADGADATVTLQNFATIRNGTIRGSNGGVVQVAASVNGFFENVRFEGTIRGNNNSDFGVSGTIVNAGTLSIESTGNPTDLEIQSVGATFSGGGRIVLGGPSTVAGIDGVPDGTGTHPLLVNAADHAIEGKGRLGQNSIALDNRGLIRATNTATALTLDASNTADLDGNGAAMLNSGTVRAETGATLDVLQGVHKNTGVFEADGTGAVLAFHNLATVRGGIVRGVNGGVARVAASANGFFENVAFQGDVRGLNNSDFGVSGLITNGGTITLESTGNATDLEIQAGGATLTGNGKVVLGGPSTLAGIDGIGLATLVNDVNHRIEGKGRVGQNSIGIDNKGVIAANHTATPLDIDPANVDLDGNGADFRNTGTLRAEGGATMRLYDGLYQNSNLIVADGASSIVALAADNTIVRGGTLRGVNGGVIQANAGMNVFVENVTIEGNFRVNNNADFGVGGTFTNNGTISIESTGNGTDLELQSSITLAGTGSVVLGGPSTLAGIDAVSAASNYLLTNSATHTIGGKGRLGQGRIGIVNFGTIAATEAATALEIQPSALTFENRGTLRAQGAAGLQLGAGQHRLIAGGVQIDAGSKLVVVNGATVTYQGGGYVQNGALTINGGGTFVNDGTFGPGGNAINTIGMAGNFTNNAGRTLQMQIGGDTAGTYDTIAGTGSATLGGTLALSLINGFDPALYGPAILLIDDTSGNNIAGRFGAVTGFDLGVQKKLAILYGPIASATPVSLVGEVYAVAAVPGDANVDGKVNFDDLLRLAQNYGSSQPVTWQFGDFDQNGTTNFDDLLALAQNYGYGGALNLTGDDSGFSAAFAADWALAQAMTPEPATLAALLGVALLGAGRRRRA